tara:strand:- start:29 stop:535 length:507 start_codon:yes stop_codon:yes gene_type:complete
MPKHKKSGHSNGQCPEVKADAKAANAEKQTIINTQRRKQHDELCEERSDRASQWADDEVYAYIEADDTKLQAFTLGMLVVVFTTTCPSVNQGTECVIKEVRTDGMYLVSCDGEDGEDGEDATFIHGEHLCSKEELNELVYKCKHCTKDTSPSPDYYWCDGCIGYYEIY